MCKKQQPEVTRLRAAVSELVWRRVASADAKSPLTTLPFDRRLSNGMTLDVTSGAPTSQVYSRERLIFYYLFNSNG